MPIEITKLTTHQVIVASPGCEECDHGRKAELEKKADDILASAGDEKLNEKELKGPAEARKKGRR